MNLISPFDPWQFGHNYQKRTALWGNFNASKAFVEAKPEGMKKFSMLLSREIYPNFTVSIPVRNAGQSRRLVLQGRF